MASLSGVEALTTGLRLIARKPALLLSWAAAWLVLGLLPQVLPYVRLWPEVVAAYGPVFRDALAGIEPDQNSPAMIALQNRMLPYSLLQLPISLAAISILHAAVYRAVLTPKDSRFGYLRFGRAELWMMATSAAAVGLLIVALAAAALIGVIVVLAIRIASGNSDQVTNVATFGTFLVSAIILGWCAVRLSMALPMTFAEQRFRLLESWDLTRGHGWKIFGIFAGLAAMIILLELAFGLLVLVIALLVGVSGGLNGLDAHLKALFAHPASVWLPALGPWIAGGALVYALLAAALHAMTIAPLTEIYRQLTGKLAAEL